MNQLSSFRVIHAHGESNAFGFHGEANAFQNLVNFFDGTAEPSTTLYQTLLTWHGSFMFGAFAILLTLGVFIGIYLLLHYSFFPSNY